jgi:hypothetical protein
MALFFQRVNSPCHHKLINVKFDPCQFWLDSPFKYDFVVCEFVELAESCCSAFSLLLIRRDVIDKSFRNPMFMIHNDPEPDIHKV